MQFNYTPLKKVAKKVIDVVANVEAAPYKAYQAIKGANAQAKAAQVLRSKLPGEGIMGRVNYSKASSNISDLTSKDNMAGARNYVDSQNKKIKQQIKSN